MEEEGSVGCSSQTNLTTEPPNLTFFFFIFNHIETLQHCDVTQVHGDKEGHEDSGKHDKGLAGAESLGGSKGGPLLREGQRVSQGDLKVQ